VNGLAIQADLWRTQKMQGESRGHLFHCLRPVARLYP
jgi:hypothetical protein